MSETVRERERRTQRVRGPIQYKPKFQSKKEINETLTADREEVSSFQTPPQSTPISHRTIRSTEDGGLVTQTSIELTNGTN